MSFASITTKTTLMKLRQHIWMFISLFSLIKSHWDIQRHFQSTLWSKVTWIHFPSFIKMQKFDFADITFEHVICTFMNLSCNRNLYLWNWTLWLKCYQLNLVSLKFWSINILLNQSKPSQMKLNIKSISLELI